MKKIRNCLPALARVAALLLWFTFGISRVARDSGEEGRAQLETALRRSAVACYAAEGRYPQDIAYLEEHYGIQIDRSRYIVFYEVHGENLMPQITVLQRGT